MASTDVKIFQSNYTAQQIEDAITKIRNLNLTGYATIESLADYAKKSALDSYALKTDLNNYVSSERLISELQNYVKKDEIDFDIDIDTDAIKEEILNSVDEIYVSKENFSTSIENINTTIATNNSSITALTNTVTTIDDDVKENTESITAINESIIIINGNINTINGSIDTINTNITTNYLSKSDAEKTYATQESVNEQKNWISNNYTLKDDFSTTSTQVQTNKDNITALSKDTDEIFAQINGLNEQMKELSDEVKEQINGAVDDLATQAGEQITDALQAAKESGEFDGDPGKDGVGITNIISGLIDVGEIYTTTPITFTYGENKKTHTVYVQAKNGAGASITDQDKADIAAAAAQLIDIPSLDGYATQDWVGEQLYPIQENVNNLNASMAETYNSISDHEGRISDLEKGGGSGGSVDTQDFISKTATEDQYLNSSLSVKNYFYVDDSDNVDYYLGMGRDEIYLGDGKGNEHTYVFDYQGGTLATREWVTQQDYVVLNRQEDTSDSYIVVFNNDQSAQSILTFDKLIFFDGRAGVSLMPDASTASDIEITLPEKSGQLATLDDLKNTQPSPAEPAIGETLLGDWEFFDQLLLESANTPYFEINCEGTFEMNWDGDNHFNQIVIGYDVTGSGGIGVMYRMKSSNEYLFVYEWYWDISGPDYDYRKINITSFATETDVQTWKNMMGYCFKTFNSHPIYNQYMNEIGDVTTGLTVDSLFVNNKILHMPLIVEGTGSETIATQEQMAKTYVTQEQIESEYVKQADFENQVNNLIANYLSSITYQGNYTFKEDE